MTANRISINQQDKSSFQVVLQEHTSQNNGIHYYPEYQISLVLKGEGKLHISTQTQDLLAGDIFFTGPNLPHALSNRENKTSSGLHLLSLYFLPDAFGQEFFQIPEMQEVSKLLEESNNGILFDQTHNKQIKRKLLRLRSIPHSPQRIIMLLSILHKMAQAESRKAILESGFLSEAPGSDSAFSKILQYIYDNFDKPISLEDMAELSHLNKYSFCRYFKRMTSMSFISYLNEFRISKACRFLTSETYNISQVGYLVGYNTLSNFYHQFNKIMNCTPSEYREGEELKLLEG